MPPIARWTLLSRSPTLARSSHCLSVSASGRALLYGGELKPRTPVDADPDTTGSVHTFDIPDSLSTKRLGSWRTNSAVNPATGPHPRVGASSTIVGDHLYVWGGRGGVDMAPITGAQAGVWRLPIAHIGKGHAPWERIQAMNEDESPLPRSYHTLTSVDVCWIYSSIFLACLTALRSEGQIIYSRRLPRIRKAERATLV